MRTDPIRLDHLARRWLSVAKQMSSAPSANSRSLRAKRTARWYGPLGNTSLDEGQIGYADGQRKQLGRDSQ
jgi:hypothetical protein